MTVECDCLIIVILLFPRPLNLLYLGPALLPLNDRSVWAGCLRAARLISLTPRVRVIVGRRRGQVYVHSISPDSTAAQT